MTHKAESRKQKASHKGQAGSVALAGWPRGPGNQSLGSRHHLGFWGSLSEVRAPVSGDDTDGLLLPATSAVPRSRHLSWAGTQRPAAATVSVPAAWS